MAEKRYDNYVTIYGLVDSNDIDNIKYVGFTKKKVSYRLNNHIYEANKTPNLNKRTKWVASCSEVKYIILDKVLKSEAIFWEKYWISQIKSWGFELVNSNNGGGGSLSKSKEFSDWLSRRNEGNKYRLGSKHSDESKKLMSIKATGRDNQYKGKKLPTEWVENLKVKKNPKKICSRLCPKCNSEITYSSIYLMGKAESNDKLCKSCSLSGRELSEITKKRISQSNKGKKKMNTSNMGRKPNKVIQLTLDGDIIKMWESISDAENELGIFGITKVCKGYRKTAGKFKWAYSNE